ncbi:GNAT family N-acetyltransferase [Actinoplanes sp. NEAU-A12]|uniref:GNAT family N-acetyltransferase n=1 Tax=Actinoplanes sandaracinus TaxID=3045177 RepID=A0ABT6WJ70_9ACTN|nr:GNAT family N-acetyltransferase [Actinoplanes sandaracinus]MDI6099751.1 GNAT family N-acetyltransferase [Actinoplanes sandaracinus]
MTDLPLGWSTRRPTLDDVPAILELVHASDIAAVGAPDYTSDEVRDDLTTPNTDPARDSWLALDVSGKVVGWAFPGNSTGGSRDMANVYFWPGIGLPALKPLLELLMARMVERAAELGHDVYEVRAGAIPGETALIEALTGAGFSFLKQFARMHLSLDGVSPVAPEPPAGVTVRPVRHGDETEMRAFHAVIEDAFKDSDHPAMAWDGWRAQIDAAAATPFDEWFVAEIGGEIAGVLQSTDGGAETDEGWVKHLAVLRPYRKRGVGEALLRRAFATYAAKGRPKAGLGVDLANPTDAASLYFKVGMDALYRANIYRTTIGTAG